MANFFASSIGKKIMMSAAGLFLVVFLLVHLGINSLLIIFETNDNFNVAADFMGTNVVIKFFEIFLFAGFLVHIIYGLVLQVQNWLSRPKDYKVTNYSQTSFFSKFMFHTAVIIFVFLAIHLTDFYFKAKFFGDIPYVMIDGKEYHDLGSLVVAKFQRPGFVIFYIASFLFLGFHLVHGFQSAFKTVGLERKSYASTINKIGIGYTLFVVAGFTAIPIVIYFIR
jgi:succinate dehydrogenase / fumarate reductase cytochrome b subunit